ncbi:MAG: ABC transporter ATP-binding protein [Oscillospiraceae bacterium]|nr:ABC transporter ATP-binding protein [Oscillospiraceae bacterium]
MNIKVQNLTKEYPQGEQMFGALKDVNFSISSGEFISITGRSGSGKSTLLNIMAGLTLPTSGSVRLDGKDIFDQSDEALSLYRNATIGCVPQQSSILATLSVLDNVRLPFYLAKREGDSVETARALLKQVGLEKQGGKLPKRLSGGQLKRVAIARAMLNRPRFLFVDEPTGDLDTETTEEIIQIFRRVADEGTAILMVTHELETTEYADKRFHMENGVLNQK